MKRPVACTPNLVLKLFSELYYDAGIFRICVRIFQPMTIRHFSLMRSSSVAYVVRPTHYAYALDTVQASMLLCAGCQA